MVGKADLVAFPRGVDNKVCRGKKTSQKVKVSQFEVVSEVLFVCVCVCFTVVEVEEEAAHVFVVDFPSAISFVLRDNLKKTYLNWIIFFSFQLKTY